MYYLFKKTEKEGAFTMPFDTQNPRAILCLSGRVWVNKPSFLAWMERLRLNNKTNQPEKNQRFVVKFCEKLARVKP